MITQLNPRRRRAHEPLREAVRLLQHVLMVLAALLAANLIGCNNLGLTPRSIVTINGITAGSIQWRGRTTVTREAPRVTLTLQPGSTSVEYYRGEARYLQPSGTAPLPEVKFPFAATLAFPDGGGDLGLAAQPLTREFTLEALITRELLDFSSKRTVDSEARDLSAVVTLSGRNLRGDEFKTIVQVPILLD